MECGLRETLQEARDKEIGRNKAHLLRNQGTKQRERAEEELKIGTWAIEEAQKAQLKKKYPEMMGVATPPRGADEQTSYHQEMAPNPSTCIITKTYNT
jgi:hypothetical protein